MMEQHAFPVIDLRATGANILRLRKERGLTVRDLQAYFGFEAPQAIYRWQSGVSLPTVDNLYALSILLNVTMEDILVIQNRSVCEQQAELDCSVFLPWRGWLARCMTDLVYHMLEGKALNLKFNSKEPLNNKPYILV